MVVTMSKSTLIIWLEATRPKTLPAAVAPVVLGTAMAHSVGGMQLLPAVICLFFALLIQVGTNFANDYLDGIRGTDTDARIGPRRAVATGLIQAKTMKLAAVATLAIAFCLGLSLIYFGGWWLLLVGAASVLCAWGYTGGPYPLAYNGLGDVFVVLFFGLIAVGFTFFVQTGYFIADVLYLGAACGFVVNNILVVNNYRDIEEDTRASKKTLVVLLGRKFALFQYAISLLLVGLVLFWLSSRGYGSYVLLGWLAVIIGFFQVARLSAASSVAEFLAILKSSAFVVVIYSFLTALGLFLG